MGDVVAFPASHAGRTRARDDAAAAAGPDDPSVGASLRRSLAQLDAMRPELAVNERQIKTALRRLGAQRDMMQWRAGLSREIERAAEQLETVIESGDLAAAERLVPAVEALVRAAATDDPTLTAAATAVSLP
jgi:hypothetical protein